MQNDDTKLRIFVERPGHWKAQAEISGKGLHDVFRRCRKPLANPFFNISARLLIALTLSASQGEYLPGKNIILVMLPGIQIEKKGER